MAAKPMAIHTLNPFLPVYVYACYIGRQCRFLCPLGSQECLEVRWEKDQMCILWSTELDHNAVVVYFRGVLGWTWCSQRFSTCHTSLDCHLGCAFLHREAAFTSSCTCFLFFLLLTFFVYAFYCAISDKGHIPYLRDNLSIKTLNFFLGARLPLCETT